jgi:hypothetical protein
VVYDESHRLFSHENSTYEDFAPEDSMQDDSTRAAGHSDEWYPWHSRAVSHISACAYNYQIALLQAVTLDIIANIPRSAFSGQQISMIFWFMKANGASQIPSAKTLRRQNAILHSMSGIRTIECFGAFGHRYYINSLADTICQVV